MLSNIFGCGSQKNIKNSVKKIGLRNYKLIENNIYLHTSYGLRENGLVRFENCTKIIIIP